MVLSANGAFTDGIRRFGFSLVNEHPITHEVISILRVVPIGYECDESHVVYGIYVDAHLEVPHVNTETGVPDGKTLHSEYGLSLIHI